MMNTTGNKFNLNYKANKNTTLIASPTKKFEVPEETASPSKKPETLTTQNETHISFHHTEIGNLPQILFSTGNKDFL